jgi:thioredoxin-like negative regulator of GroEL
MPVERISEAALHQLLTGQTKEATCVIKFYSNGCEFCHALSTYYKDISDAYEELYFFAFNIDDNPDLTDEIGINGVPSITLLKTGTKNPRLKILEDPEHPHEKTWYTSNYIKKFIEKEK